MQIGNWIHQPQEREGKYRFTGQFYTTATVSEWVPLEEITMIYWYTRRLAQEKDGLDYLQVFVHKESGDKLFFIDQIDDEVKKEHPKENDYCTLLYADEY